MEYLVIADTHLGCTTPEQLDKLQTLLSVNHNTPIIWLGDTIDILVKEDSFIRFKHFIRTNDIEIAGNHDYKPGITRCVKFRQSNADKESKDREENKESNADNAGKDKCVFMTHGDLVDFGLAAWMLQEKKIPLDTGSGSIPNYFHQVRSSNTKSLLQSRMRNIVLKKLIERMSSIRQWSLSDIFLFYTALQQLSDQDVQAFFSPNKLSIFKALPGYLSVLLKLLRSPVNAPVKLEGTVPALKGNSYLGLFTKDPEELLDRVLFMYPESVDADIIIIGHIHHKCDVTLTRGNKQYRFIVLGAWVGDVEPSYVKFDSESLSVEVKEL